MTTTSIVKAKEAKDVVLSLKDAIAKKGIWQPILNTPFGNIDLPSIDTSNAEYSWEVQLFEESNKIIYIQVK